ncbi:MAG: hypothetical protein E7A35_22895, partial [Leclercia adecarboxylata]|nr:hypothetical protein [Leclercia adecarboxylata]
MHRIDTPTAQKDKWGAGKNGYTNGDPTVGVKSTALNAEIFDSLQEEICNVIEKFGVELDPENNEQLWTVLSEALNGFIQNGKLVESMTDTTAGRIPVVGWMGIGGPEISIPDNSDIYRYFSTAKSGNYGGGTLLENCVTTSWHSFKWQQHGERHGYLLEFGSNGIAMHLYDNPTNDMVNPQNYWMNTGVLYSPVNKPTAADVGALSIEGGWIYGPLVIHSYAPIIELSESDTGKKYFIVADGGGFRINEDSTAGNEPLGYNSGSKQLKTSGQFIPGDYANFDARYQSKGSYSPPNAAYKAANGYWQCTSTGMIFQWAQGAATTGSTNIGVTFPRAFPNACFFVSVSTLNLEDNAEAEQAF